jgi:mono/diheme cytochrome c family protein
MTKHSFSAAVVSAALVYHSAQAGELTVVPFAVPVAVPVAVVQQPTLFYGVSRYATIGASSPVTVGPPAKNDESQPDLRGRVDDILVRHCAECHRADRAHGDLTLFDVDGRPLEKLPRQWLVDETAVRPDGTAAMPPGNREKLSKDEWETLQQWARMPKSFVY